MSPQTSSLISKTFSFQDISIRVQLSKSKILEIPKQKSFDKCQKLPTLTTCESIDSRVQGTEFRRLTQDSNSSEVRAQ